MVNNVYDHTHYHCMTYLLAILQSIYRGKHLPNKLYDIFEQMIVMQVIFYNIMQAHAYY